MLTLTQTFPTKTKTANQENNDRIFIDEGRTRPEDRTGVPSGRSLGVQSPPSTRHGNDLSDPHLSRLYRRLTLGMTTVSPNRRRRP